MAEEEEAWKVLMREQTEKAAVYGDRAHALLADADGLLSDAIGNLETLAIMDSPEAWSDRARRAEGKLADAWGDLAAAASLMAAARLIALCGAAASPEAPLRSVDDIPDEGLRFAMDMLGEAKDFVENACDLVGVCCAHLSGVGRLLAHPLLPGLKGLVNVKLVSTRDELNSAREFEEQSTSQVDAALVLLLVL